MSRSVVAALLLSVAGGAALAQSSPGPAFGFGAGVASSTMSVAGSSASGTGLTLHAAFGVIEAEYQAFPTPNPLGFEEFTALSVLAGPKLRLGGSFVLQPAVGLQYRAWSGTAPVESGDWGPVLGIAMGPAFTVGSRWRIAPQLTLRAASIEAEGSVWMYAAGVRAQISRGNSATGP